MTLRPLSEATARVASQNFERKYIALGRIVEHWGTIAGQKLADKAQPIKINYRKANPNKRGSKASATLDIAVSSANATLLHYQKDLILERINQVFGERWITAIRFVHAPVNSPLAPKPAPKRRPLTQKEDEGLKELLEKIEDPVIKEQLQSLGQGIIRRDP